MLGVCGKRLQHMEYSKQIHMLNAYLMRHPFMPNTREAHKVRQDLINLTLLTGNGDQSHYHDYDNH